MNLSKKKQKLVGQRLRIYKYQYSFTKGYVAKWSNEIFRIKEVINTKPITYKIEALDGEKILGKFYTEELQRTSF